jgi:quercetin dioxygenase-like cupin family protein
MRDDLGKGCKAKEYIKCGIWHRFVTLEKVGDYKQGHKHKFDHITTVISGKAKLIDVDTNKPLAVLSVGHQVIVEKGVAHSVEALEPKTVFMCQGIEK